MPDQPNNNRFSILTYVKSALALAVILAITLGGLFFALFSAKIFHTRNISAERQISYPKPPLVGVAYSDGHMAVGGVPPKQKPVVRQGIWDTSRKAQRTEFSDVGKRKFVVYRRLAPRYPTPKPPDTISRNKPVAHHHISDFEYNEC